MTTTWRRGAFVLAGTCALLAAAPVAPGQSRQRDADGRATRTTDVIAAVVDGGGNPLLGVAACARTAAGGVVKGAALPDGTCLIPELAGEVKLVFEHAVAGPAALAYTPTTQPVDFIRVELSGGRATLLPPPESPSDPGTDGSTGFREAFCDPVRPLAIPFDVDAAGLGVYTVIGTGTTITASTCNQAGFDTVLTILCGACAAPSRVIAVDDSIGCAGFTTSVSWCSRAGTEYLVLVHGFGGAVGEYTLSVTAGGVACTAQAPCGPTGACCLESGDCVVTTAEDCAAQGGEYLDDGTDCGELIYALEECADSLEDISATGTLAPNASSMDDAGDADIPIGFEFAFFGAAHTTIGIASNGYLSFGTTLSDFSNDAIPSTVEPNDIICPYWDDWSPNEAGDVYFQTLGSEPQRRFITQWDGVEAFGGADGELATFQAVLFEGSNCIEFRYGEELFVTDQPTVGVENFDGTEGYPGGFGPAPTAGGCLVLCPELVDNPCQGCEPPAIECFAELVGDGGDTALGAPFGDDDDDDHDDDDDDDDDRDDDDDGGDDDDSDDDDDDDGGECLLQVSWEAVFSPDCAESVTAVIDIGCDMVPVENGQLVDLVCRHRRDRVAADGDDDDDDGDDDDDDDDGDDDDDDDDGDDDDDDDGSCESETLPDGTLRIRSDMAVLIATAIDTDGNVTECFLDLCTICGDDGDDDDDDDDGDDDDDDD